MTLERVSVPPTEAEQILVFIGKPLVRVIHDWSVTITTEDGSLTLIPEEVATPTPLHPDGHVVRMAVEASASMSPKSVNIASGSVIGENLGIVSAISILTTAVFFTPPKPVGPTSIMGVEIPAGDAYEMTLLHPQSETAKNQGIKEVDIGLELNTESTRLFIYTDGVSYFINPHRKDTLPSEIDGCVERYDITTRL